MHNSYIFSFSFSLSTIQMEIAWKGNVSPILLNLAMNWDILIIDLILIPNSFQALHSNHLLNDHIYDIFNKMRTPVQAICRRETDAAS